MRVLSAMHGERAGVEDRQPASELIRKGRRANDDQATGRLDLRDDGLCDTTPVSIALAPAV